LDNELSRVVSIDMPLVAVEYVVMFIFVAIALSYGQSATKVGRFYISYRTTFAILLSRIIYALRGSPFI